MDNEQENELRQLLRQLPSGKSFEMLSILKDWNEETVELLPAALSSLFAKSQ